MAAFDETERPPAGEAAGFRTTHWSVVLAARQGDDTQARLALSRLCRTYWYPLYAYARRRGLTPHDAQDLTQEFFARLLEKGWLADVGREKGRFRSFLLSAMNHFLANQWVRLKARKRGGGLAMVPLDAAEAEDRYKLEPADPATPETVFQRRWALTLLDEVLGHLQQEYAGAGKGALFEALKPTLTGDQDLPAYTELGRRLDLTEGAVKVAIHRLRRRYREVLRAEIAQTVDTPEAVDEELRELFQALTS